MSPTCVISASVFTSNEDGTYSTIVVVPFPTKDSILIVTSNEFGLVTGSILL